MMVKNRYKNASMSIKLYQKDISVIAAFAHGLGMPTPLFTAALPSTPRRWDGTWHSDTAAVCAALEKMAGATRKRRKRS